MKSRTIKVDYLARVEGEGALLVKIKGQQVTDVKFKIFEPPRFFEAFLRGRKFHEAPDITARICGICPIAYQMSACHAIEDACGIKITGPIRDLRRLIYCGEWIESHALHVYLLHAPDFLGYEDAIRMAKDHPDEVKRGLRLKKAGNEIVRLLGGREIHPINVRVGGFYKVPAKKDFCRARRGTEVGARCRARHRALGGDLHIPDFDRDYEFVALRHPDEYPFNEGRLVSNKGLDIAIREYDQHFVEDHVAHSNALQSRLNERNSYFVGPLARYNLNFDKLSPMAQEAARSAGLGPVCRNPFQSIIVRSVEMVYACDEALRIIEHYEMPDQPAVNVEPRVSTGYGCTEAPRGICYHRYRIDDRGIIVDCQDCSAHLAEPEDHRETISGSLSRTTSCCPRTSCSGSASRRSAITIRASRAPPTF